MAIKNVTNLDFEEVKANLKSHLQAQDEFSDYNFDASGLSVLVDLLAYNTHYNAVMAHLVANESFIDSAVKRNSVVSIAKTMGYTPRSARSARATIDLTITPDSSYSSSTLFISRLATFTASVNGKSYSFLPASDTTITKTFNAAGVGQFIATGLEIVEGRLTSTSEVISTNNRQGPVLLPNDNVDTTTIKVTVKENTNSSVTTAYSFSDNILDVTSTSKVFYIEESTSGKYEIYFGDGVLGKKLDVGNIVQVEYVVCAGTAPNGARAFKNSVNFTGAAETVTGTVSSNAGGGAVREDVESIRFTAPRFNAVKNRIVTKTDYETVIKAANPNIKSVTAWGGEDNDPPIYGRVFVSLQPESGFTITQSEKATLLNDVISLKQPITMSTQFVDPEFTHVGLNISATYDPKLTTQTPSALQALITAEVETYFNGTLNALKKNFYYSFITNRINNVSKAIIGNNIELRLQKRLVPALNVATRYEPKFNNKILPNSIRTNYFNVVINGITYSKVSITDTPDADVIAPVYSGKGILKLTDVQSSTVLLESLGTIDYDTGALDIPAMSVASVSGTVTDIRVSATPHEGSKNISTDVLIRTSEEQKFAITPLPARNVILTLDSSASDTINNIRAGVSVTMVPRVAD
tara:strand:- start:64092 stop:66005 length:1914 start_codon:yes stop_codon:yes gene_type:complete